MGIKDTVLWKHFEEGAKGRTALISAVDELCRCGEELSSKITVFFRNYTRHDHIHIDGVCRWMADLLGDDIDKLSANEAAVLLLAASWHDTGMNVSKDEQKEIAEDLAGSKKNNIYSESWEKYFSRHPGDKVRFSHADKLPDEILRNYIRENHHNRIGDILPDKWPACLTMEGISRDAVINVCRSHGEDLGESPVYPSTEETDFNLCAVLLRLADLLDFDVDRAPESLFSFLGLGEPETAEEKKSSTEYTKTGSGTFSIENVKNARCIVYRAEISDPQTEHEIMDYLNWTQKELSTGQDFLASFTGKWSGLRLPAKILPAITPKGYRSGDFCLTMDQDRIIDLLAGEDLYSDPGVFVRELLQNSIDAVLDRCQHDPWFEKDSGQIDIYTWQDNEGYACFCIEDNGTGMDENIIHNYFLKIGRSYYTSDEYKSAELDKKPGFCFHPTSRFGIGILSCFMTDKERNTLEVETQRYSESRSSHNPTYRLKVTGLHGYYYFYESDKGAPMPKAPGKDTPKKRKAPGTTVCVRLSRSRMGLTSFRKIVDKYVVFPDITVNYHDLDTGDSCTYPTQDELMACIHALNTDMEDNNPEKHIYPLPDKYFVQLKEKLPEWKWGEKNRPQLILSYYPLDRYSVTGNTFGFIPEISIRIDTKCIKPFTFEGMEYYPELIAYIRKNRRQDSLDIIFRKRFQNENYLENMIDALEAKDDGLFFGFNDIDYNKLSYEEISDLCEDLNISSDELRKILQDNKLIREFRSISKDIELEIPYNKLTAFLSENEKKAFQYLRINDTLTAYNGILADSRDILDINDYCLGYIMLLRNNNYPRVNIARNSITSLPLETACELITMSEAISCIYTRYYMSDLLYNFSHFNYIPEAELQRILENHPSWENRLRFKVNWTTRLTLDELTEAVKSGKEITIKSIDIKNPLDHLKLAVLKRHFHVSVDSENDLVLSAGQETDNNISSGLPVILFFSFDKDSSALGNIQDHGNNFNKEHRFSKWLIENHEKLMTEVPEICRNILNTMIYSQNTDEFAEKINKCLRVLRQLDAEGFRITNGLDIRQEELNPKHSEGKGENK